MSVSLIFRTIIGTLLVVSAPALFAPAASAAAAPPTGSVTVARQDTFEHQLFIAGWAYDPARPRQSVRVRLLVDGTFVGSVLADRPSPQLDERLHISGAHGYTFAIKPLPWARTVIARSRGALSGAPMTRVGSRSVYHFYPPPGTRIIDVAKRYVGYPYVDGGASPSGFDCSGYTQYAYKVAKVHYLVHNAEQQMLDMRRISRADARPGDLVFYLSGGTAYHVAIYAGHGWQYAAATPRDGVRYQPVWSSAVRYGTDWHR